MVANSIEDTEHHVQHLLWSYRETCTGTARFRWRGVQCIYMHPRWYSYQLFLYMKSNKTKAIVVSVIVLVTALFIIGIYVIGNTPVPTAPKSDAEIQAEQRIAQKEIQLARRQVSVVWDIPKLMGKTHNQIVSALGKPTMTETDGVTTDVFYQKTPCHMTVCGNDLSYTYKSLTDNVSIFYIFNFPVEHPTSTIDDLKAMGNIATSSYQVVPIMTGSSRDVGGKTLGGISICSSNVLCPTSF